MSKRFNQEKIINEFKQIHDNQYDYSLVDYQGDSKKIKIICKIHGIFEQQVAAHKRQKQGCPHCSNYKKGIKRKSNDQFINKIEDIFGKGKFDYSLLEYRSAHHKVRLICKKCGNIEEKDPTAFYKGFGCLICQGNQVGPKIWTREKFITKAKQVHGEKYNYSKIDYKNTWKKIEIICNKHGSFWQVPNTHIHSKSGCPKCSNSKGEEEIAIWLNQNGIKYKYQFQVKINNSNHYFDFYLLNHNIIIEFNGMQHYKPIEFFGGQEGFNYLQLRDKIKEKYCLDNNIQLIKISYKDNLEQILEKTLIL